MKTKLFTREVGPYSMNTYVIVDDETKKSAIIDPGGDPELIIEMTAGTKVEKIFITHGHGDHVMALDEVRQATGAPVYLHPADAKKFGIKYDHPLSDGDRIPLGSIELKVIHVPGHTPGQCCFDLGDHRIVVGDTVFVGGPGRTATPEDFKTTMENMVNTVFNWPENTVFYPGHGPSGTIGMEKPIFEAFVSRGWSDDTHGDVTWE
jgi:glyoxylase-like metal-dependent hydrolase (beta-lactamase superfamily II)